MEDGSVLTVPAGEVQILNGTVFVSDSFLIAQGLTASSNNTVLLLALGAAGVAVAANALESSSDSDDNVAPPVATPPPAPPPMPPVFTSSATAGVAENQTDAYRAVATDADSDTLSYSLSGTDASRFMIDAATGEVSFIEAPDFEAPGDADADNVYDIIVTASDGANTAERTVAIMVTDENEAPIFTSDAAVSVAENQTAAYAAVATDADGNDLSYNLSGTDAALFMIDGATGEVRFIEAPDFENPGDADGDNVYDIVVTASDGTSSTDQAVAITVTDETDSTAFQRLLDNPRGASVADFDAAGIERVNALTLDAARGLLQAVGENDPATLAALTPQQVQAITDIARDHIVSISGPEDAGIYDSGEFTLGSNPAIVSVEAGSFIVALDYDGDGETDHIVTIEFDADYRAQRIERDFGADNGPDDSPDTIEVIERPDDRTVQITYDIQGDGDTDRVETYTLDESGDRIQIDVDTDADGSTDRVESYEVDADGNRIQIDFDDNADGEIDRTELDDDADGNPDRIETYTLDENGNRNRVRTDFDNDSDGTIDRAEFDDDADGATDRSEIYTYDASGNRARTDFDDNNDGIINRIESYTLDANGNRVRTDLDDNNDGIIDRIETYTLDASGNRVRTNSDDNADGNIDRVEFDDDADGAADRSETYIYDASGNRVRTDLDDNNDGTVDRVDFQDNTPIDNTPIDNTPIFSSAAAVRVAENQTEAYTAVATHADGDPLSYSLSGTDAALFTIDPTTGAVSFIAPPDFENAGDAGGNNVYDIIVTASDGTNDTTQAVAITVTDVNDNDPVFTSPATASVAENQRSAYTAVATNADGDPLTYSLSGTDAALFTIDPATGVVSFRTPPDFEMPGSADGDNVYDITVTASDGDNTTNHDVVITVTDEDEVGNAPAFTSPDSASVEENQTVAYTAMATDADGDTVSYSLSGGADAALFTIDETTGVVSFMDAPDFEDPGDAGGNNVYDVTVTASDGDNSTDHDVAITVTDVNDNAPVFSSPATASVAENQSAATVVYRAVATDADGDALSYSLSGTDAGRFTINAATGEVSFNEAPDVENPDDANGDNVYDIIVTASDGATANDIDQAVAITVTDANDNAPVFSSPATATVAESPSAATVVYRAVATDADGDALSYSLSGTDAARFMIDANTGEVRFSEAPDAENPGDDDGDNVYDIIVTASDGAAANDIDQAVTITLTNVNDNAPVFSSPATATVAENQRSAYTAVATDADGDPLTYSLSGTDAALFTIDPATGVVSFRTPPDFEMSGSADGDNVYDITVTASDGDNTTNHDVVITVTDEDEVGNAPAFTSPDSASVEENQTVAYTAMATDADGDTVSYSLSRGADAALFTIDETTGVVSFMDAPDFEDPGDAGGNNVYDITVTASDGDNSTDHDVAITVTDVNDNAPVFSSPATASVAENQSAATVVYRAVATDADGDALSYSLSGTDAARFTINAATGEVSFNEAPDVENPDDANGDNVYDIIVTASDGATANDIDQAVAITVTDANDNAPVFSSPATATVAESPSAATVVYRAVATDADGDALSYSLSGTDAARFMIDANTGEVRFSEAPDAENPGDDDGDNVYDIIVTASDGAAANDIDQAVTITVTNVNDNAPVFSSPATATVAENQRSAYTAVATDADGDPLSYSLSGTDAALFTIDPATGVVSFRTPPDFEMPGSADGDNVYDITVTASDGDNTTNRDVVITVTDEDEVGSAPAFTSPDSASVAENQTMAYTAIATDADGDPLTYSLSGTDAALFTIDPATGVVSFIDAPDFEDPDDAGGDNVYNITVTASDSINDTPQTVAITVTNENDNAPVFSSPATASVAENQSAATVVYRAVATDADGDALSYSLSGTDAARFTIDANTGEVRFREAPDAENPGDDDNDNVYDIIVTASDDTAGTTDTNQAVAITVTDANDNAPVFSSPETATVAESPSAATVVYRAVATDADGDVLSYSLSGTDASRFTIDANTGDVRFREAPDAENPGDDDNDNVYDIIVTASDNTGGTTDTDQAIAITVTGVNDNAPVFNSPETATVAESPRAAATDADGDVLSYSLSGTDAARFTIDANTGEVRFREAPDAENPGDDDNDNVYDIIVTASDNTGGTPDTNQAVAITVTDANDNAPVFNSPETATVAESPSAATVVYRAVATDADGDALSYSLSGTDAARFTIDANTGEVRFREAPDAENPGDDDNDNVYDIIVTASDDTAGTTDTNQAVAITVTDANDNAPVFSSPETATVAESPSAATVVYRAVATDADGDALTYSLSGTDAARFTIDPNTGDVRFREAPDAENPGDDDNDNVYDIIVTASDNTGGTSDTDQAVAITVTGVNDNAPVFNSPETATVAESPSAATVVYRAVATDADGDALSYSLSGTDAARFTIDANTGEVRFREAPDAENPGDDDNDNVYDITVTASDDDNSTDHDVAITVTNINDNTPSFTSPDSANVAENETLAYTAVATDADGDDLSYSLSGTDAARFTIDPATGAVRFIAAPDFENPGDDDDDNVYDITVTASDDDSSTNHDVTITVTNENDNDPLFNSGNSAGVAENQNVDSVVYTAMATDADGDTLSYSLSGTDAARFTVDPNTGAVRFIASPDFENPDDAGGDNVYNITVTASDDDNSTDHDVAITVTNINDNTPSFTSPDSANVAENETLAYTAVATDADGDDLTYSLSGTDAARFTINPVTGAVSFMEAPDFENPDDAGGDNVYNITVTASDDTNESNHDVAITVTNENDNDPIFISGNSVDVVENQPVDSVVYTAIAADADGDPLTYGLSGTDAALFTIDPATGVVSFITPPDFEDPGDAGGNNIYNITVTASDGDNSTNHNVAITVTNENDNDPSFTSDASVSVAENQTAAYTALATDADGDPLTHSLSGTDAGLFTIDPATGVVSFNEAPDAENPDDANGDNVYDIIVTASDNTEGTTDTNQAVAITVTNVNDNAPVFTSPDSASVAENQTAAYMAVATDADEDPLTYSLSGTDAARFTINETTGEVSFNEAPDVENPDDANGDNVYNIVVTASDNTEGTTDTN